MSTLQLPAGFNRFIDSENGVCLVEMTDRQSPIKLEVYVKTTLTVMEEKEVRIGFCDDQLVWCEITTGCEGEIRPLTWSEMEMINEIYGDAIPLP